MAPGVLDTVVCAATAQGTRLELRPAGLTARCYAFLLDTLIKLAVFCLFQILTLFAGGIGIAVTLIVLLALEWFYPVVFELSRWGATPGKRSLGLRVVMDNGLPLTPPASLIRNLLRVADFLPFLYGFAIVSMLVRRDFKRLGDLAAATLVVYAERPAARVAAGDRSAR